MSDTPDLDRRIKELEALIKEHELSDKTSARPLFTQSFLTGLPIVLTVGLGFVANYYQSRYQHAEQVAVLAEQGRLERGKQEAAADAALQARVAEADRAFKLQDRDASAQLRRQEREFAANSAAAASRFAQEQHTLRSQHAAEQAQQNREFDQSLERQRRETEVALVLKASEVPTSLAPEQQDVQRARNLLWFVDAGHVRMDHAARERLRELGRVAAGQRVSLPVVQATGGTAGIELAARFEGFIRRSTVGPAGEQWIGYGHDLTQQEVLTNKVRLGDRVIDITNGISEEDARALLRQDMGRFYGVIDRLVKVPLTPSRRDALAVFVSNVGPGWFEQSQLLKRLNKGEYDAVPDEMRKRNTVAGRTMLGLVRRRESEIELWNRSD